MHKSGSHIARAMDALMNLGTRLSPESFGNTYWQAAIKANPWYSHFYIARRMENIQAWLQPEVLSSWLAMYPGSNSAPRVVGLITAGNLPLVGFHDLMCILLSGHKVALKCSRKDEILMNRMVELWQEAYPALAEYVLPASQLSTSDFLIGSGSSQTARQLRAQFPNIPMILRQHRFSAAVLDEKTSEENLGLLAQDIFLFNGLGCRSVSNVLLPEKMISPLINALKRYPPTILTPAFQQKVTWERAKMQTLQSPLIDAGNILIQRSEQLESPEVGVLKVIPSSDPQEIDSHIQKNRNSLQCIVNKGTEFGMSQYPAVDVFEDNVDLLEILTRF